MDDVIRGRKPPLEVRREFTTSRLETQALAWTYELIVPVIRKPVAAARTLQDLIEEQPVEVPPRRMAQGV